MKFEFFVTDKIPEDQRAPRIVCNQIFGIVDPKGTRATYNVLDVAKCLLHSGFWYKKFEFNLQLKYFWITKLIDPQVIIKNFGLKKFMLHTAKLYL
jgi:hypothetical protein